MNELAHVSCDTSSWLPTITVIIPAYNSSSTIGACIESLLAQDYPHDRYSIIIVDNRSTDPTPSIVQEYPVTLAFEHRRQTAYAARNCGLALAETEFAAFTDADCIVSPCWLRKLIEPFCDPTVGVTGGPVLSQPADTGVVEAFMARMNQITESSLSLTEPKAFPGANVAYRRAALSRVGVFDDAMFGGGDVDLAWRVQGVGEYQGVYVPDAVIYHKHRSSLPGIFRQYKRYGLTEIVLTTLYRNRDFHKRTPSYQLRLMARQCGSLGIYCASFLIRLARRCCRSTGRLYVVEPLLHFVIEAGSLAGKLQGLFHTRGFRRNPYRTDQEVVKRTLVS